MNKANYFFIGIAALILGGALIMALAGGPRVVMSNLMSARSDLEGLDTSVTRLSEQGDFKLSYTSSVEPIPVNKIHSWTLHVENEAGQPLEGAQITVGGGMPQHRHGLPTRPQVTQDLGKGDYLVEGMKFNMPGWWEVKFQIEAGAQSDNVTFNLVIH